MSVRPRRRIVKIHCFMKSQEWVCRSHPSKKRFDVVSNTSKCFHQNLTLLLLSRSAKVEFAKCRDYKTWNMGFPSQDESPALTVLLYSIWTNDKSSRTTRTSEQNIKSAAKDLQQGGEPSTIHFKSRTEMRDMLRIRGKSKGWIMIYGNCSYWSCWRASTGC